MKVKATQLGYYDLKRRPPGAVFELNDPKHFSSVWMAKLVSRKVVYEEVEEDETEDGDIEDLLGTGTKKAASLVQRRPVKKVAKPINAKKGVANSSARRSSGDREVI
jgi:hypothetical protein